jgi:serine protease Do
MEQPHDHPHTDIPAAPLDHPVPPTPPAPPHPAPLEFRLLSAVVLISVLFGAFGGLAGALYFAKLPSFQKIFSTNNAPGVIQQGVYKEDSAVIDVVKRDSPAVVSIVISKDLSKYPRFGGNDFFSQFFGQQLPDTNTPNVQEVGAGSGFFVSADGLIVTNKHVVADEQASYTVVTTDGQSYQAQVLSRDPVNDLALVKIDIKNAPTLPLVDSTQIQIGQQVVAIGNSLGQYQNTVTSGIVSGTTRSNSWKASYRPMRPLTPVTPAARC